MSFSAFLYFSHYPPHTAYSSSPSHHHLSTTHLPATSIPSSIFATLLHGHAAKTSQNSHFFPLKLSYLLCIYGPSLTSMHHCTLHKHVIYSFSCNFNDTSFLFKIPDSSLNLPHAQCTPATVAQFALLPPSAYPQIT